MDEAQKQAAIFFSLIASVVVGVALLWFFNLLKPLFILILILVVLLIVYSQTPRFFVQLEEYERAVVFRYGAFHRLAGPGWVFLIPFLEGYRKIDLRVRTVDIEPQEVVTKDSTKLTLDAILYLKVSDPKKAILAVEDYEGAAVSYTKAHLRDVVGHMNLDRVISEIGEINKLLQEGLQEVSDDWGVRVDRVEIQKLVLPEELMASMHRKKAAEQDKMATVERAEAQRMTIDAIQSAAGKLTNPALQYLYIQSLQKIAEGKSNKIIFPLELSRLATGLANKLGTSYSEAQDKLVEDYQEKVASGAKPRSVIDDLRRELGIREEPLPKKKYKLAKGKVKFDF